MNGNRSDHVVKTKKLLARSTRSIDEKSLMLVKYMKDIVIPSHNDIMLRYHPKH